MPNSYTIVHGDKGVQLGIRCLICGKTSYNINDIENKYCGSCRIFHEEVATPMCPLDRPGLVTYYCKENDNHLHINPERKEIYIGDPLYNVHLVFGFNELYNVLHAWHQQHEIDMTKRGR